MNEGKNLTMLTDTRGSTSILSSRSMISPGKPISAMAWEPVGGALEGWVIWREPDY